MANGEVVLVSIRCVRIGRIKSVRLGYGQPASTRTGGGVIAFTISKGRIEGSTILYFGLVLMERCFDGRFQSRSAKWLEHIPKGAGSHCALHRSVISMRGEKDDRHMEVAADSDCANDAIDS